MKFWRSRTSSPTSTVAATPAVSDDVAAAEQLISSGQALEDNGQPAEALTQYLQAIERAPQSAKACLNAGNAYRLLQDNPAAIGMYRRAAKLDPASAAAQLNLGTALLVDAMTGPAEQAYREALRLRPDMVEAWVGLGCVLDTGERTPEAIVAYTRALEIQPAHAGAASNLSSVYMKMLDVGAARQTLVDFLRHCPDDRMILQTLAAIEEGAGRIGESLAIQRALVEREPFDFRAWSMLIFNSCYVPELTAQDCLDECRRFGHALEVRVPARSLLRPTSGEVERRLRVGYVSADFRIHPVANFMHPVLRCHDRGSFEVFCYHAWKESDRITADLKTVSDHWRDVATCDDDGLADIIQQDRIDILVDLSGHSGGNRLGVFARKPAPIQFTWLGYLGTTGLSRMDYRLCDARTDPVGVAEAWQTEIPARLPDSQWCYDQRIVAVPAVTPLPRSTRGFWTFGSFNNYRKLNDRVLAAWAQVLKAIPDSRLRLFSFENAESGERAVATLTGHGIERRRIDWLLRTSPEDHFDAFADIDIALDSFPYNGATTTCDAFFMGVPVLVVDGERSIARGGTSLLNTIGLADWIADTEQQLPAVAQRQLASVDSIARLRAELRPRMRGSALMDAARFTQGLEAQYRSAWHRMCQSAEGA
ncbi:MAG: tetratricopeptide repeat protein [Rudaea sp.]|nr:tetratricopeptide repeat protein [Rudaea sp.]